MTKYFLLLFFITGSTFAQYTTPGTGVDWNLDSLVMYSGGVVTGTYPNYNIFNKVFVSVNDLVRITPGSRYSSIK